MGQRSPEKWKSGRLCLHSSALQGSVAAQEPAELCLDFPSVTKAQTKPFSFIEPVLYNSALGTLS